MVKMLLEYFTHIDEVEDFFQLVPTICNYFENTLGWHSGISGLLSIVIAFLMVAIPIWAIAAFWNFIKNA